MRLEGTLDAFSLPEVFQLLSYSRKTGTLHVRREQLHGVVHLRDGAITGARSDVARQALGRRLVGAGLIDDEVLADAVEAVLDDPSCGLARALAGTPRLDPTVLRSLAGEQATDAVFDLLRWPDGEFAFQIGELDPDDLGASLPVEDVVAEGRRRMQAWSAAAAVAPAPADIVTLVPAPADDPVLTRDEWALLALVDGARTVSDLIVLSGRGEYLVVNALSELAARGLLAVGEASPVGSALAQRQQLLAALEGGTRAGMTPPPSRAPAPAPRAAVPDRPAPRAVARDRPEPVLSPRSSSSTEPAPALAQMVATTSRTPVRTAPVALVSGAHALQPDPAAAPAPSPYIERDAGVNKSLLLRLIAGVRGL